jgi:uncharacterized Rmd1/YagE family protein
MTVTLGPDSLVYAFNFGALVFVNVSSDERSGILEAVQHHFPREPHPPLEEDFLIEVRPDAVMETEFDRVVLPAITPAALEVIATVLAQSVSIDYYDEDVQAILNRIGAIAGEVAEKGSPRGRTRDLTRFIGAAIASQVEMIESIALLDKPDLTWEDEAADRLHDKLRAVLEIPERYKALEVKLQTIRESLQTLIELGSSRRMLFLETAIVLLIVLEIVMSFARLH